MGLKSTDIKVYVHSNSNAQQLSNNWGALVNVLDSCLTTGYNCPAINTASVSNNILSIDFGTNHNLLVGQVILLAGANQSIFNREFRIANIPTLTQVQIDLDSTFSSTITGTLTATVPPLGWIKEFSEGGKRAYRNAEKTKTDRPFLRVIDEIDPVWDASYAKYAKVGIVENMKDINTMLGLQTPFDPTNPDKNWIGTGSRENALNGWAKWYYSRVRDVYENGWYDNEGNQDGNKRWLIVGNKEWFYILQAQVNSGYPNIYFFGNLGSAYGLSSSLQYDTASRNRQTNNKTALSSSASSFLLHIGTSTGYRALGLQSGGNDGPGGSSDYYEPVSERFVASDVYISVRFDSKTYRNLMPSFKWLMNPYDANYELKTFEDSNAAFLLKTVCATTGGSTNSGLIAFQLY